MPNFYRCEKSILIILNLHLPPESHDSVPFGCRRFEVHPILDFWKLTEFFKLSRGQSDCVSNRNREEMDIDEVLKF